VEKQIGLRGVCSFVYRRALVHGLHGGDALAAFVAHLGKGNASRFYLAPTAQGLLVGDLRG
jgi:hypothetical protein